MQANSGLYILAVSIIAVNHNSPEETLINVIIVIQKDLKLIS